MGVILVVIGLVLIGYGLCKFLQAAWALLKLLAVPFMSEKKLDKELFKEWEKGEDYREWENRVDEL